MNIFQKIKARCNYSGLYKDEKDIADALWTSIAHLKFDMQVVRSGAIDCDVRERINHHSDNLENMVYTVRKNGGVFARHTIEKGLCDNFINTARLVAASETYKNYYVQLAMRAISQAEQAEDKIRKAIREEKELRHDLGNVMAEQANNNFQRTIM